MGFRVIRIAGDRFQGFGAVGHTGLRKVLAPFDMIERTDHVGLPGCGGVTFGLQGLGGLGLQNFGLQQGLGLRRLGWFGVLGLRGALGCFLAFREFKFKLWGRPVTLSTDPRRWREESPFTMQCFA